MARAAGTRQGQCNEVSVKHIGLVLDHYNAPPALKLVAIILADHADSDGICWPSYRKIAERACLSERSVRRHVKELQEAGIVTKLRTGTIVKREGQSMRISNAYRINAHVLVRLRPVITNKLSTNELGISDTAVHLEVATGDRPRWTPMTTKPSIKRNLNHNGSRPVENPNREPVKINLDGLIDQMFGAPQ